MATKDDTRAALLLLALALIGALVRFLGVSGDSPGEIGYRSGASGRPELDSVAAAAVRLSRPLEPGERIDIDWAEAAELARLPRIGPALAARIVTDRDARGRFGSLEALTRVSGVGPGMVKALEPFSTFSGTPGSARSSGKPGAKVSLNTAEAVDLEQLPGIGATKALAIVEDRRRNGRYRSVEELTRVRGIGPATIERLRGLVTVR